MHRPTSHFLTGTANRPVLTFSRRYATTAVNLRGALHDLDRLERWFGSVGGSPAAVGDEFTADFGGDPEDIAVGTVLVCEDDLVQVSWTWQGEPPSVITARVIDLGEEHAELRLDHALAEPEHAAGYGGGWEQMLQALARSLSLAAADAPADEVLEAQAVEHWRTITRAPLELHRRLEAPLEQVWEALASADGLRRWWWSHWPDVTVEAEVRPGGSYRIHAPSAGIELSGTYLAVDDASHLSFTWEWADAEGRSRDEAVDLRLEPTPSGSTLLTVRHTGPWAGDAPAERYRQGWTVTLDQLGESLTR